MSPRQQAAGWLVLYESIYRNWKLVDIDYRNQPLWFIGLRSVMPSNIFDGIDQVDLHAIINEY